MALSYNHLYDLVRRERSHQELQELAPDFYSEAKQFFQDLSIQAAAEPAVKAESTRSQLVNARKLYKQLYEAREQKILHLAQTRCRTGSSLDTSKLVEPERVLFERIVMQLNHSRAMLAVDDSPELPKQLITIKVLKPVAQFLGASMETYGPFTENETVELPAAVAQVLIRKGVGEQE